MEGYEKKTYLTFVLLWAGGLAAAALLILFADALTAGLALKAVFFLCLALLAVTGAIIYKKERVYWLTTYSYEEAAEMEPEQRRRIGKKTLLAFSAAAAVFLIYGLVSFFADFHILADSAVFLVLILAACIFA